MSCAGISWRCFRKDSEGVSPVKKLTQGYSYVTDENGHTLTDAEGVKAGDRVKIRLLKGALEAEVTEVLHER